jgi:surface polysaccharide O-acyltransferase-like enzyme
MNFIYYNNQFIFENLFVIFSLIILLFIPRYANIFWNINFNYNLIHIKRLKQIDAIKGISIIAVILIHSCYLIYYQYIETNSIIAINLINNISRFAIPVFLFTSGLLLKPFIWDKKYIFNFYFSKFIRIGIPYILVNLVLWQIGYNNSSSLWKLLITGDMAVPFYFIPVLFQLYILYPLLDYMAKLSPKYLLLGALMISIISFFIPDTWNLYDFPLFMQYLIFFVYGMLRKDILNNKISNIWGELIIIYLTLQAIFIIPLIYNNTEISIYRYLYFYNFQLILGFGFIFTMVKYLQSNKFGANFIQNIFAPIGKISLWIFLLHFPIQQFLADQLYTDNLNLILYLLQNFILTIIISIPISWILGNVYLIYKAIKNNLL